MTVMFEGQCHRLEFTANGETVDKNVCRLRSAEMVDATLSKGFQVVVVSIPLFCVLWYSDSVTTVNVVDYSFAAAGVIPP